MSKAFLVMVAPFVLLLTACDSTLNKSQEMSTPDAGPEVSEEVTDYMPLCSDQYVLPTAQRANWQEINDEAIKASFSIPPDWSYEKSDRFGSYGYDGYRIASYDVANTPEPGGHEDSAIYVPAGDVVLGFALQGNDRKPEESALEYMKRAWRSVVPPNEVDQIILRGREIAYDRNAWQIMYALAHESNMYAFEIGDSILYDAIEGQNHLEDRLTNVCTILDSIVLEQSESIPILNEK